MSKFEMETTCKFLKCMSPVNIYKSASAIYMTGLAKIAPRLGNPEHGIRRALAELETPYLMVPVSPSETSVQLDETDYSTSSSSSESEMETHRLGLSPREQFNRHLMQFANPERAPRLVRQIEPVREAQQDSDTEQSEPEQEPVPEQELELEQEPELEQESEAEQQLAVEHTEQESQTDPQTEPQPEPLPVHRPQPEPIQFLEQHSDYLYDSDEEVDIVQSSGNALDLPKYKMKYMNPQCNEVQSNPNVLSHIDDEEHFPVRMPRYRRHSHYNQVYQNYRRKKCASKKKRRLLTKGNILNFLFVLLSLSVTVGVILYCYTEKEKPSPPPFNPYRRKLKYYHWNTMLD